MRHNVKQYSADDLPDIFSPDCYAFIIDNALDAKEKYLYKYYITPNDKRSINYVSKFMGVSREYAIQITKRLYFANLITKEDIENKIRFKNGVETWESVIWKNYYCDWGVSGLIKRMIKAYRRWKKEVKTAR